MLQPDEEVEAADNMDIIGKHMISMKMKIICIPAADSFMIEILLKNIYIFDIF